MNRAVLSESRRSAGLSLRKLADAVGVNEETVRRWENGVCEPRSVDHVERLSMIFGKPPVDFGLSFMATCEVCGAERRREKVVGGKCPECYARNWIDEDSDPRLIPIGRMLLRAGELQRAGILPMSKCLDNDGGAQ